MNPRASIASLFILTVSGCGGSNDDGGGGLTVFVPPPSGPPPVQTGVFKDFNVTGLDFVSGAETGTTDANGRFTCETGNTVAFSVGAVTLGEADCGTLVMPTQLATEGSSFDLELANIARFIRMLDEDVDPDNDILISDPVRQIADTWAQVHFSSTALDTDVASIVSDAASVDPSPVSVHALPSPTDALTHLLETLSCAFAGAYRDNYVGSSSGPASLRIGSTLIGAGFTPFAWEALAIDGTEGFTIVIDGGGTADFTFGNLPAIDRPDIQLAFVTPDRVSGTWAGGTVSFDRIGADDGSPFRLVGVAQGAETDTVLSLNFDGSAINGQAFETSDGTTFEVTGAANGSQVSLTATGGGQSFTAIGTLTNDGDGNPSFIVGTVSNGANLGLAACRLNRRASADRAVSVLG